MNKFLFCLFVLISIMSGLFVFSQNETRDYVLVFSDEFNQPNGSKPDDSKWICAPRAKNAWARWISDSKDVAFIKNGKLICRAVPNKKELSDTATMLTGAIETKGKFAFQYGKVEVRMRTNLKTGNFPAVWMVPDYTKDKRYAEIDIVEMFGNDSRSAHNVHTHRSYNLKKEGIRREFKERIDVTKWHVYGVIWTKESIVWTVDGKKVGEYKKIHTPEMEKEGQWTFDTECKENL